MKIIFIYPNVGSQLGFNYGVSYIAAVLKQAGHHVEFRQICEDLEPLPTKNEFLQYLKDVNPDIIGFSVVTNQWRYATKLANWAREALTVPLVCGGIHATLAAKEILETGAFDYVFLGESEEAFLEFVEKTSKNESVQHVQNMGMVINGEIQINPVRPLPDLQCLPVKAYEIFDFQKIIDAKNGWVGLMASRGCPFKCTYCFNPLMVNKYRNDLQCSFNQLNYIRHHSVKQIIDEIIFLQENYKNISTYIFDDDLFTYDKDYVEEFCKTYKKVTDIPFVVNAHVGFFDETRARYLADAGCRIVKFGLESGSDKIRSKVMNRHMSNEKIMEAINYVHQYHMHSSVFIIIGLPNEGRDDVMDTITFLSKLKPGRFRWTFFFPFPGTELYQMSLDGGYINKEKVGELMNFTDESALDFGEEHNLFLEKVGRVMPWFVNSYADFDASPIYNRKVNEILKMDRREWEKVSPTLLDEDKIISAQLKKKNKTHYAVKYNRFMGVISDYFMNEK
ncbi:MAG: B12-binding domain-containing radical SAM protein [Deltaproteobacteria bacterium]|nr:B12-binding domain-containing radical SAM protein [Deltaproteobacteria bacterium]